MKVTNDHEGRAMFSVSVVHFHDPVCNFIFFFLTLSAFKVGEDYGTPLEYFCLENPMDGGAW